MSAELNGQPRDQQGRFQEKSKPPQSTEETISEYMKHNQSTEQQPPAAGQQQKPPEPQAQTRTEETPERPPQPSEPQVGDMKEDSTTGETLMYVKEDGEGMWVDKEEAAKGYMRRSHFTRKTQQVNEQLEHMQGQQAPGGQQQFAPNAPRQGLGNPYGNQVRRGPDTGARPEQAHQYGQAPQGYQQRPPQVPAEEPDPIEEPRKYTRWLQANVNRELRKRDQQIHQLSQQLQQQSYQQGRQQAHKMLQDKWDGYDPGEIEEQLAKMPRQERQRYDSLEGFEHLYLRNREMQRRRSPRQPQNKTKEEPDQPQERHTPYAEAPRGTAPNTPSGGQNRPLRSTDEIVASYMQLNQAGGPQEKHRK